MHRHRERGLGAKPYWNVSFFFAIAATIFLEEGELWLRCEKNTCKVAQCPRNENRGPWPQKSVSHSERMEDCGMQNGPESEELKSGNGGYVHLDH